ncbi:hypothetical protein [Ruegeria arenilitoris]|uniref:hypothetical protein n=1 Tax=Ruegeria arenilitoris TaxID=1173585 RepID=UPI00147F6E00|nr:hypothetical protein [Ruegeria arenilitoris]
MHQRGTQINDANALFLSFCRTRLKFFSDFHLYSEGGEIAVDRVLRYESLDSDLAQVLDDFGLGDVSLGDKRLNSGIRKSKQFDVFYGENWDGEAVDLVADLFRREIDAFGYQLPTAEETGAVGQTAS